MKNTLLTWRCPLCGPDDAVVSRGSAEHLEMAVAAHIVLHETRAGLKAVDAARISCRNAGCEIGKNNAIVSLTGNPNLQLTDFDKTLLAGMRISKE
jgi:hypothetical protein